MQQAKPQGIHVDGAINESDTPLMSFHGADQVFQAQRVGIDRVLVLAYLLELAALRYRAQTRRMPLYKPLCMSHRAMIMLLLLWQGTVCAYLFGGGGGGGRCMSSTCVREKE